MLEGGIAVDPFAKVSGLSYVVTQRVKEGKRRGRWYLMQPLRELVNIRLMLTPILSRQRQKRLLAVMEERNFDAVLIAAPQHVYYFTAHWTLPQHLSAFVLFPDGRSILITANTPNKAAAADDVRCYEANLFSTLRDDQPWELGMMVAAIFRENGMKNIGVNASVVTSQVVLNYCNPAEPIEEEI